MPDELTDEQIIELLDWSDLVIKELLAQEELFNRKSGEK